MMVNFKEECKKCGNKCCASNPCFFKSDIKKIKKEFPHLKFKKKGTYYYLKKISHPCLFLKNNKCCIQKIKPIVCQAFPLILNKNQWFIDKRCPITNRLSKKFYTASINKYLRGYNKE